MNHPKIYSETYIWAHALYWGWITKAEYVKNMIDSLKGTRIPKEARREILAEVVTRYFNF